MSFANRNQSIRMLLVAVVFVGANVLCYSASAQKGGVPKIRIHDGTKSIVINTGSHYLLEFTYPVPDVWVGNQVVMSAVPMAPNEIMISGAEPGITTLTVSDNKRSLQPITVHVKNDVRHLQAILNEQFADALIQVNALKNGVVLRGVVSDQEQFQHAFEIAEDYYPGQVLNQLRLGGNQLVAINVRVYEVARSKLRQLGVDWSFFGDNFTAVQSVSGLIQQIGSGTSAGSGQTLTFGVIDDDFAFNAFLQALEQKNLAKLLDEPTLVTSNGRSAEFLSGGEIPIQISTNFGGTSIEYRDFGTKLDILPTIHGQGELTMEVRAEVSDIAGDLSGAGVPGFRVRRINTGIRMKVGHTLALAGDYREETETTVRGIPGLMDAPVFGAMFRTSQEQTVETELVFLLTPSFIDATDQIPTPPGRTSGSASSQEFYQHGTLEVPAPYCPPMIGPGATRNYPSPVSNHGFAPGVNHVPNHHLNPTTSAAPTSVDAGNVTASPNPIYSQVPGQPVNQPNVQDQTLTLPVNAPVIVLTDDQPLTNSIPIESTPMQQPVTDRVQQPVTGTVNQNGPTTTPSDPFASQPVPAAAEPVSPEVPQQKPELPGSVQPQSSISPNNDQNSSPETKFNLPNPFENRRPTEVMRSPPGITGPYGFSK